jgi:hypothetical protein
VRILTVENQAETIGLHINLEKGIKLTLANYLEVHWSYAFLRRPFTKRKPSPL